MTTAITRFWGYRDAATGAPVIQAMPARMYPAWEEARAELRLSYDRLSERARVLRDEIETRTAELAATQGTLSALDAAFSSMLADDVGSLSPE